MTYLETVAPAAATGAVRAMYDADLADLGYVSTDAMLFSLRPAVRAAFKEMIKSIRATVRLRQYELVTLAAARALGCEACVAAHGAVLLRNHIVDDAQLEAIVRDFHDAGLTPLEVATMDLAEKVAFDARSVIPADFEALRAFGLGDADILDLVLVAAARAFYSKTLQALGVPPSPELGRLATLVDGVHAGRPAMAR